MEDNLEGQCEELKGDTECEDLPNNKWIEDVTNDSKNETEKSLTIEAPQIEVTKMQFKGKLNVYLSLNNTITA